ncbi:MAG: hypothetical protein A2Y48_10510 [Nitrospirae bacterium RIFCSPLOW2_12_42_9]|nr:MAG: hypothetical protein A2Z60_00370 [Nitrospirae bacterium RIFCSPLOWO2_02_42_7]OGW59250.1 MAG: hypothetical protein A3D21_03270 [Nitrospirae bacterium RIFCSPHIGHO2_02_FULL_42_12]OGW62200.1 MAG: hypothetical protein A2Y48_10510 [Nitrospirae bacterium RIFCSPLOW2_12_42_9]HBI23594.1 hypothetical protein [Nitrospiraceae bacterium]
MGNQVIKRYFEPDIFEMVKNDLKFLIKIIITSGFEYDLQIREKYFNLYYRGNSLSKVTPKPEHNSYEISIHEKFFSETEAEKDKRFTSEPKGAYLCLNISRELLHPFFQIKHLKEFGSNIKNVNYQEEITFEQMLITDNVNRQDFIIIDRQVMDHTSNQRMDLLALKQKMGNDYQFCVVEVKLGNNPELQGDVIKQLEGYVERISKNFEDYKKCYELNFKQKKELDLYESQDKIRNLEINIVDGVSGIIVVGGYSCIAKDRIEELKQKTPDIRILPVWNMIDFSKAL